MNDPFDDPQPKGLPPYWLREYNAAHELHHLALLRRLEYIQSPRLVPKGTARSWHT